MSNNAPHCLTVVWRDQAYENSLPTMRLTDPRSRRGARILGETCGKSTLRTYCRPGRSRSGNHQHWTGRFFLSSPRVAGEARHGMVHQHFALSVRYRWRKIGFGR